MCHRVTDGNTSCVVSEMGPVEAGGYKCNSRLRQWCDPSIFYFFFACDALKMAITKSDLMKLECSI